MKRGDDLRYRIVAIVDEDGPATTERGNVIRRRWSGRGAMFIEPAPVLILDDDDVRAERYTYGSAIIELTREARRKAAPRARGRRPRKTTAKGS